MRPIFLAIALLAPQLHAAPAIEKTYTLEDALKFARKNDSSLLTAEQTTIIARHRVTEARLHFLPEFGIKASATKYESKNPFSPTEANVLLFPGRRENIYTGRSYLYMPLYEGLKHVNTLKLAKASHEEAKTNYQSIKRAVQRNTTSIFYRLILAQERHSAAQENETALEEIARYGRLGQWERVETEALLGAARVDASKAKHDLSLKRLDFLKVVNLELNTPFRLEGKLETKPADVDIHKAVIWAMDLRPELRSQTYKAQMDSISVNLALSRRHPTLFVAADYEVTGSQFPLRENNWDATIGVKLPFTYDFFSQLKQKKAEQRQGQLQRAALQDRVRLEVRQAHAKLLYWQKEYPKREALLKKVRALFKAAASAQTGGGLAKARAAAALAGIRLAYLESVTEHVLALANLEWAVGRTLRR